MACPALAEYRRDSGCRLAQSLDVATFPAFPTIARLHWSCSHLTRPFKRRCGGRIACTLVLAVVFPGSRLTTATPEPGATERATETNLAIENVAVVDVARGRVIHPKSLLIVNGRIVKISDPLKFTASPTALRIDGKGHYVIPGLVDMHVHLFNNSSGREPNAWMLPLLVSHGVTGVREMSVKPADMSQIRRWRAAAERHELIAPQILAAGAPVSGSTQAVIRKEVRAARDAGADFIKVFSQLDKAQWKWIASEARRQNMRVCGHVPPSLTVLAAATGKQRTNEHLTQIYEACSSREKDFLSKRQNLASDEVVKVSDAQEQEVLASYDQLACDQFSNALARTAQVQVPTLVLPYSEARGDRTKFRDDSRWPCLRPDEQARWERILAENLDQELAARRWDVSRKIVSTLHRAGVNILAGTDSPMPLVYPGSSLHQELELFVDAGFRPAEALRAATLGPAEFFGLEADRGTIAIGKRADLVLLDDDPLVQIRNIRHVRAVILNGRYLSREDLDHLGCQHESH